MARKPAGTQRKIWGKTAIGKMRRGASGAPKADLGRLIRARILPAKLLKGIMSGKLIKVSGPKGSSAEFMLNKGGVVITATVRTASGKTLLLFRARDGIRLPDKYLAF